MSLIAKEFSSFWTNTETFEALRDYIVLDFDGLRDGVTKLLAGDRIKLNTAHFANDMSTFTSADDVFALLIHLGYLGYDSEAKEAFIPNKEIRDEYVTALTQMRENRYSEALAPYAKENDGAGILLVGISYDKDSCEHECLICER